MSFWNRLKKPIIVLAPLANVTDASFRQIIAKYSSHVRHDGTVGGPDVMWTEFVSADGLIRASEEGKEKLMADLLYIEAERPIVAQLFSSHPEYMEQAAALCLKLGFDGIDINMGCPDRTIEKQGCGSAMIRKPDLAREIICAAKRGAGGLPVSVKTRIGYNKNELETWLPALLSENPAAITIHVRTRKEMSKVPARWEHIREAVHIRNEIQNDAWRSVNKGKEKTLILGNGDVMSLEDAYLKANEFGADGVMLGRAIFGNPWLFNPGQEVRKIDITTRLKVMIEHTRLFEQILPFKNFSLMKKHYKAYVNDFDGAKELRALLMDKESSGEIEEVVNNFLKTN
ncbi:MAG: tRNA-dihydrouridine synthase [Candidatus Pacebacteria bacterium]|nr:tRNA-dihydrouridine synthase [Candidatus Paceibacterota bacterium]MCF7857260.1 tRNA-dihydrouridine synthase [Candidatus Paceibacterota bacterium]